MALPYIVMYYHVVSEFKYFVYGKQWLMFRLIMYHVNYECSIESICM